MGRVDECDMYDGCDICNKCDIPRICMTQHVRPVQNLNFSGKFPLFLDQ